MIKPDIKPKIKPEIKPDIKSTVVRNFSITTKKENKRKRLLTKKAEQQLAVRLPHM